MKNELFFGYENFEKKSRKRTRLKTIVLKFAKNREKKSNATKFSNEISSRIFSEVKKYPRKRKNRENRVSEI